MSARKRHVPDPPPHPPDPPASKETADIEEERYQEWLANARFVKRLLKAICAILTAYLVLFICLGLIVAAYYESNLSNKVTKGSPDRWSLNMNQQLDEGVMELFQIYDSDASECLEPWEFQYIAKLLNEKDDAFKFREELGEEDGVVVHAEYVPIDVNSMKTFQDEQTSYFQGFLSEKKHFTGLFTWRGPARSNSTYSAQNFRAFLPPADGLEVGTPYRLISSMFGEDREEIYNANRYYPPQPTGRDLFFFKLLQQFHDKAFLQNRFGPRGGVAVIRAQSGSFVDIAFRIHAEFQINEPPQLPFWYTPAHFTGHILMDTATDTVYQFEFGVPISRRLNVDMEWIVSSDDIEGEKMEVDIGYIPSMKLYINQTTEGLPTWEKEISFEEARADLDKILYPFKKIPYLEIREAVETAKAEDKLVHSILMWGSLDDQSC